MVRILNEKNHPFSVGIIFVEWDNGKRYDYRYGRTIIEEAYDLVICDEPRPIPRNKPIATGCLVRRGNLILKISLTFFLMYFIICLYTVNDKCYIRG